MPNRLELPPALRALVDVGAGLLRRAPSAQIAVARAGALVDRATVPADFRAVFDREVAAARDATSEPIAFRDVERELRDAWGRPPRKVLDELDRDPLAVRPAAQVHRGEVGGVAVAVKVRRPGVERAVRNDLALLDTLSAPLRAAFPNLDAGAVLRDVREQALDELDFEHEASQQRRVGRALRGMVGVAVPRPHLELCASGVLVSDLVEGTTLADGGRPEALEAAATALVGAFRAAALDAGLAPVDARPGHVVVGGDGTLGLLGMGVARPVERERAVRALDALDALAAGDEDAFAAAAAGAGVLPDDDARRAHGLLRPIVADLSDGPATLDAAALLALGERAEAAAPDLAALATRAAPHPQDLALGRMLGQLVAVLARLEATLDWPALARA